MPDRSIWSSGRTGNTYAANRPLAPARLELVTGHIARVMVLVTIFVTACTLSSPTSSSSPTPSLGVGSINWTDCGKGFQCGTLSVPLDYSNPQGRKISLALIKKPKAGSLPRIGSLLYNPGGPGESGIDYLRDDPTLQNLNTRFDLVAWDPRGIGGSTRISCVDNATLDNFLALDSVLDDPAEKAAAIQADKAFVAGSPDRPNPQLAWLRQSVRNAWRFCSKPTSCRSCESLAETPGSTTPSSASARTCAGNRCAYHCPSWVP